VSGPRADWPGPAITWKDVLAAQDQAARRTVAGMWWYVVIERWWPENHTADLTVYEYPTELPDGDGRQVWGCILQDVDRAEDLIPAAERRLEPAPYTLIGQWQQAGDRWLARVAVEHLT
jgi:hypothetical protein